MLWSAVNFLINKDDTINKKKNIYIYILQKTVFSLYACSFYFALKAVDTTAKT